MSNISILGLYQIRHDLFSFLLAPEEVNHEALVGNILIDTGNLEAVYPDADFMTEAIALWSQARLPQ